MISQEDLQELLALESESAPVVSLYLDTNTAQTSSETIKRQARAMLKEAECPDEDVEAIENYLDLAYHWDKPGLAVFSCAGEDYFRSFPAAVSFRNRVRVGTRPHVKPLAHLLDHYAHYGVAVVDRVGARYFEYHLGELQDSAGTMGEDVRKLKRGGGSARGGAAGSGQRGGQGARHEAEVAQRNLRDAAEVAEQFFNGKPIRRLFIGGTTENVAQFRELLSKRMQSRIAGTFAIDMTAGEHEVREQSLELLQEANQRREQELVDQLITTAAKGGNAVTGLADTLRTVSEGRVQTLILSDGYRAPGYRHQVSHFLAVHANEAVPFGDEEQVQSVDDIVEEAVSRTIEQGGHVEIVSSSEKLDRAGRIGALLRY
ncbi:MAG: hypothetical protein R3300_19015 [Candidatus Promineifilaceae bacterium]|nr:hypothetical protein [Candidatus Promineifilaceae bacterium]